MSGRPKTKCYQYDEFGKYLQSYDSIEEVREKYYYESKGKYPFFVGKDYQKLPDGTFIANYKIGRNELLKQERINNCKFCDDRKLKVDKKVEIYNLKNEKIAEFKNPQIAALILDVEISHVFKKASSNKKSHSTGKFSNLTFKLN